MQCPKCNTKIRKFSGGFICQQNHKYPSGTTMFHPKIYDVTICPMCKTKQIAQCKCINSERWCINNHVWTHKYYEGDKRYFSQQRLNDKHVFEGLS